MENKQKGAWLKVVYEVPIIAIISLLLAVINNWYLEGSVFWDPFLITLMTPLFAIGIVLAGEGPNSKRLENQQMLIFALVFGLIVNFTPNLRPL